MFSYHIYSAIQGRTYKQEEDEKNGEERNDETGREGRTGEERREGGREGRKFFEEWREDREEGRSVADYCVVQCCVALIDLNINDQMKVFSFFFFPHIQNMKKEECGYSL